MTMSGGKQLNTCLNDDDEFSSISVQKAPSQKDVLGRWNSLKAISAIGCTNGETWSTCSLIQTFAASSTLQGRGGQCHSVVTWNDYGKCRRTCESSLRPGRRDCLITKVNMDLSAVVTVREFFEKYKKFVENNVETVGHLESAARILSYVVPGIVCRCGSSSDCRNSKTRSECGNSNCNSECFLTLTVTVNILAVYRRFA